MSALLIALAVMQATPGAKPAVPGDVMFLFFKVFALRERSHDLGCRDGGLDARYDAVRKRLIDYYGPSIFSPKKQPKGPPGDCGVNMVYQLNLADLERAAATAMSPKTGN